MNSKVLIKEWNNSSSIKRTEGLRSLMLGLK